MSEIIIECVPNISEGRNLEIINSIVDSAREINGVSVLGCEPDSDYNRTVITIAGDPTSVTKGAYAIILKSLELIDMREHNGNHPRMGAVDVCPFVPLSENSMDHCINSNDW
jgi:glutamate formiminotransferase